MTNVQPEPAPFGEWQPIETAPKNGKLILTARKDLGRWILCVGKWAANTPRSGWYEKCGWMSPGYQGISDDISPPPTFWMPLPRPPR